MAYDRARVTKDIINAIKEHKLTFFDEICLYVEPALSTLYEWELEKSEDIKNALKYNKIHRKTKMRHKWEESDNATLQIAAFKLIADDDEIGRLSTNINKNENSGELSLIWNEVKNYGANEETNHSS